MFQVERRRLILCNISRKRERERELKTVLKRTWPQKGVPIAMAEPSIQTHEKAAFKPPIQKWEDMPGIGENISKYWTGNIPIGKYLFSFLHAD